MTTRASRAPVDGAEARLDLERLREATNRKKVGQPYLVDGTSSRSIVDHAIRALDLSMMRHDMIEDLKAGRVYPAAPVDGAEAKPVAWWIEADGEGASFFTRDSSLVGARKTSAEFTVTPLYTHPAPASPDVAKRCAEIADELSSDELFLDEKGRFGAELTAATIREEFNLPDTDGTAAPLAHRADAKVIRSGKTVQLNAEERADRDARGLHVEWAEGVGYHYFPSYDPKSVATAPASPDAEMVEGLEMAAKWVEQRRDDYVSEHGSYDYSTGFTEFPDGGEYVDELEEIIEGIRAILSKHGGKS